jgi:hypothetical protein
MPILLALISGLPRVWLDLRFFYKSASPRFSAELPKLHCGKGIQIDIEVFAIDVEKA